MCNVWAVKFYFNSHAHVERDDFLWNADETKFHFNSHAHVERDPEISFKCTETENFNSHAHVERDFAVIIIIYCVLVFQLTRSRGA